MTDGNDVGFDAWRGKVVGGGDPNPFHPQAPIEEVSEAETKELEESEESEESEEKEETDKGDTARTMVAGGILPGAIFDTDFMNEAIKNGYNIFHSNSGYKDNLGSTILEIVISDGDNERVVGYTTTKNPDEYVSLDETEIN
jgi:hypothetical protein